MCGIAGQYRPEGEVDPDVTRAMVQRLTHRGPDDEGYLQRAGLACGMRRLSIIDLAGGAQPIWNEQQSVAVLLNGQIYNYRELRADLVTRGHRFRTDADTEVLVHLYEERGRQLCSELNGMFAFALWDEARKVLLLARDRLGIKPLYYAQVGRKLTFSSELKSLLLDREISRDVDRVAVAEYLKFGWIRAPRSPFEAVRQLEPGTLLSHGPDGARSGRYWQLRDHAAPRRVPLDEAGHEVCRLLEDSVRLRLRSDVPVGAFLSGGLDSSSIVALAAANKADPLDTFLVDFGGAGVSEAEPAQVVADRFNTRHHTSTAMMGEALERLPELVWQLDQPLGDSSMIPTFLVSRHASAHVTVALSGVGGDELFGGYERHFDGFPFEHAYRRVPARIRRALTGIANGWVPDRIRRRLEWNLLDPDSRYLGLFDYFDAADRSALVGAPFDGRVEAGREFANLDGESDAVNRVLLYDLQGYLPADLLHLADRLSMASSLEVRTPFLDHRLVEYAVGLPGNLKVRRVSRGWKLVLKEAMAAQLPESTIRRSKWGFQAPVAKWMSAGLDSVVRRTLRHAAMVDAGLVDPAALSRVVERESRHPGHNSSAQRLWHLLVLEVWCRVFLLGDPSRRPEWTLDELRPSR